MIKFVSIRRKLIIRVMIIISLTFLAILTAVLFKDFRSLNRNLNKSKETIQSELIAKGTTLTQNNATALTRMVEDNSFGDIRRLVSETVKNDLDIAYGIFMGADKRPWAMADKKDANAIAALYSGATTTTFVNGVSASTDLASTDEFNTTAIVDARVTITQKYYRPSDLIISPFQEGSLLKTSNIYKANEFGTRSAIANGMIGNLFGFDIYVSDNISASSNVEYAVAMGKTRTGEPALAYAVARDPRVEMDKDITYRLMEVVGSERYQFQVIHPDAVVAIGSYQ